MTISSQSKLPASGAASKDEVTRYSNFATTHNGTHYGSCYCRASCSKVVREPLRSVRNENSNAVRLFKLMSDLFLQLQCRFLRSLQ